MQICVFWSSCWLNWLLCIFKVCSLFQVCYKCNWGKPRVWLCAHHNKKNKFREEPMRGRGSNKCERTCTRWKHLSDTVPRMRVCSLSVANVSLKSNIKTAKVSPAVCCRGRSEHMDLKSMPTRDTFSISMYILGVTPFTCMTVHVSQGHFSPFLPPLPCLIEE